MKFYFHLQTTGLKEFARNVNYCISIHFKYEIRWNGSIFDWITKRLKELSVLHYRHRPFIPIKCFCFKIAASYALPGSWSSPNYISRANCFTISWLPFVVARCDFLIIIIIWLPFFFCSSRIFKMNIIPFHLPHSWDAHAAINGRCFTVPIIVIDSSETGQKGEEEK